MKGTLSQKGASKNLENTRSTYTLCENITYNIMAEFGNNMKTEMY